MGLLLQLLLLLLVAESCLCCRRTAARPSSFGVHAARAVQRTFFPGLSWVWWETMGDSNRAAEHTEARCCLGLVGDHEGQQQSCCSTLKRATAWVWWETMKDSNIAAATH